MAGTPTSFQTWYDASKQLTKSIQRYLDASITLETTITCRSGNDLDTSALDKLFAAVRNELVSRYSRNDKIKRSDAALCRVFNQSTKFVPVQRLSPELLVRIFSLACQRCGFFPSSEPKISKCQTTKTMLDITHVCTDWRKLAINTPLLWSHVDMRDSNPYEPRPGHEKVWLERARSVPLSVQAAVREESDKLPLLGPYLGAVHSLGFQSDSPSSLRAAVAYWMSNGTPGSVQELSLIGPKKINRFGKPPYMDEEPGADLFTSFIDLLKVLRLRAVDLSNFILYEGLVHLELSYLAWYADPLEYFVASRLLGCPDLRVLKLDTLTLSKVSRNWLSKPLNLNVLERLEIVNMSPDPCLRLLPMLAPGPGELDLRLEVDVNSQDEGELISFFSRSNVTKFYFKVPLFEPVRMDWMSAIPNLQMLVLDFNAQSHPNFRNSVLETLLCSETSTSRFPKLRTLWVIDYYVDIEILKRVVETCRIETLIISVYSYLDTRFMRQQLGHLLKKLIMEPALPHSVIAEWYSRAH